MVGVGTCNFSILAQLTTHHSGPASLGTDDRVWVSVKDTEARLGYRRKSPGPWVTVTKIQEPSQGWAQLLPSGTTLDTGRQHDFLWMFLALGRLSLLLAASKRSVSVMEDVQLSSNGSAIDWVCFRDRF